MSEEKLTLATLCPLCWRPETEKVEGDLPCIECQEAMKKGFLCVGVDFSQAENKDKPVRTGHRWIISPEAAKLMYDAPVFERGAGLIDIEEARKLGLPIQMFVKKEEKKEEGKADLTLCGICNLPIHKDEFGGIHKEKGFMHKKCMPLELIKG